MKQFNVSSQFLVLLKYLLVKKFISHSVQDEHFLLPILDTLQELYELDIFTCATIPPSTEWYPTIESNLRIDSVWAFVLNPLIAQHLCF